MIDLPLLCINIKSNDNLDVVLEHSFNRYDVYMGHYKVEDYNRDFIKNNVRNWIMNIKNSYHNTICHQDEFYVTYKTHEFSINVKLTYFLY